MHADSQFLKSMPSHESRASDKRTEKNWRYDKIKPTLKTDSLATRVKQKQWRVIGMSAAKQRIAIVGSAILLLNGCANQSGGQARSGTSTSDYVSEPRPSTTMPWGNNLGAPPMLPAPTLIGR